MKLNYETCIVGKQSILVPYRPEHVNTYHEWMKDPYLLEMTASEPLSLEEEIEMQESWINDNDKCTFIILYKDLCHGVPENGAEMNQHVGDQNMMDNPDFIVDNINVMIGDVNLFLSNTNDEGNSTTKEAELDIMVAVQQYRNKGIGKEVVQLIIYYGITKLNISRFFVKINDKNTMSLKLFQDKFNFKMCGYTECFKEYELEYIVDGNTVGALLDSMECCYRFFSSTQKT